MKIFIDEITDMEEVDIMPNLPNSYEHVMSAYENDTDIPDFAFEIVAKHHFPSCSIVLKDLKQDGKYDGFIIKVQIKDILSAPIKNWKCNRPPDKVRCKEIAKYIYKTKEVINTAFYLTYDKTNSRFDMFDGIHRLTALKKIKEENSKPFLMGEFGCNKSANWLYEQYVIVYMYFNASDGAIVDLFKSLNKSISVPELYLKDRNNVKIEVIESVCKEWVKKYKKHFSESSTPNLGNINRDTFIDLLDNLYDKYNIYESEDSIDELKDKLEYANKSISQNIPSKIPIQARRKCEETGCYLFLYRNEKLLEII